MKIASVKPIVIGTHGRNYGLVKVATDDGFYGIGEVGLGRRAAAAAEVVRLLQADLLGQDPRSIEHLWQMMFRGGFFPGGVVQSAAVSAIDIALWDLKGKVLGAPVYELLGGPTRDKVVCYPHCGGATVENLVSNCKQKVDEGWRFVRWGLSDPAGGDAFEPARAVRHGIDQVKAVREALGEEVEIIVDVHTRLDPPGAIEFCKAVEPYRPFFIEDPLRSENPGSLALLRQHTSVPIAVGEQFDSKWAFKEVIERDLMDYCRVDVCLAGGLTEARKIAAWCETHYIRLAPHNPLGPVAAAACLHLCLSSPLVGVQEMPRVPSTYLEDVFPVQVPFKDGDLFPTDRPGLGIEFNEAAALSMPALPTKGVGFRRDDGAYTNW